MLGGRPCAVKSGHWGGVGKQVFFWMLFMDDRPLCCYLEKPYLRVLLP